MKTAVFIFACVITFVVCGKIPHSEPRRIPLDVQSEDAKKRWFGDAWNDLKDKIKDTVKDVKDFKNEVDASIEKAKNELDQMGQNLGSQFNGVKNVVEKISIYLSNSTKFGCQDKQCELCFNVPVDVSSDKTSEACVNIALDNDNYGLNGTILFDDKVVTERKISAKNLGSMCIPLPQFPAIEMCVRPYEPELNIKKKEFKICLETNLAAFSKQLIGINLNCFLLENGKDFYLSRPTSASKNALINLDAGKLVPNFDQKLKLTK